MLPLIVTTVPFGAVMVVPAGTSTVVSAGIVYVMPAAIDIVPELDIFEDEAPEFEPPSSQPTKAIAIPSANAKLGALAPRRRDFIAALPNNLNPTTSIQQPRSNDPI
jgi:hypothetical protein